VAAMKPGSLIVDMAAEQGGNCELTEPGKIRDVNGVKIVGYTDLASRLPTQASKLYGTNMAHLLKHMEIGKGWKIDMEEEIVRGALVAHQGQITYPPPKPKTVIKPVASAPAKAAPGEAKPAECHAVRNGALGLLGAAVLGAIGLWAPADFLPHFTVFVLAIFVGYMVVWNVTPALHTPLMSVTNAISGIIVIGAMLQISGGSDSWITWLAAAAVLLSAINIFGGFLVTRRMLAMFRK
jgi:NAD(P) transhydrogenase subunit alpha